MNNSSAFWVPTIASTGQMNGVNCLLTGANRKILFNEITKKLNKTC